MDYLGLHHVITVSTPSFTGMPHADTVIYVNDDLNIYFYVLDGSTLARNIRDSKYVSFTIDDYLPDWQKLRELQGVGRGELMQNGDATHVAALVAAKFGATFTTPPGRLHRLAPIEMHFVHYDDGGYNQRGVGVSRLGVVDNGDRQPPVATSLDRVMFESGEVIFRAGEHAGQFYVVVSGVVEIRSEGFGADQTVTRVGPGQLFGNQTGTSGQGVLTAHAVEPTALLIVEPDAVRDLVINREP